VRKILMLEEPLISSHSTNVNWNGSKENNLDGNGCPATKVYSGILVATKSVTHLFAQAASFEQRES
jgi:hypothetical protein